MNYTFQEITTPRMKLRMVDPAAYHFLFKHCTDQELIDFMGLQDQAELEQEKERYAQGLETFRYSFCYFQMLLKDTNNLIGGCGYHTWYTRHFRAEIGYEIKFEKYHQQGLMTEALHPILQYGFEVMKLNRIEAFISPDNGASLQLVKNAGFTEEGLIREHYFKDGGITDSLLFSLLKREWDQQGIQTNLALVGV